MSAAHWSCVGESDNQQLPVAPRPGNTVLQIVIADMTGGINGPRTGPTPSSALLYSPFNHICFESFSSLNLQICIFCDIDTTSAWPDCFQSLFFCPAEGLWRSVDIWHHVKRLLLLSFFLLSLVWNDSLTRWWPPVRTPTYLQLCTLALISTTSQSSCSSGNIWFAATSSFFCGGAVVGWVCAHSGRQEIERFYQRVRWVSTLIISELQY